MKRLCIVLGLIYFILMITVAPGFGDECPGDLDGNGVCDGADLAELASDYGSSDCPVKTIKYITCEGVLSSGGRWCDNTDGTVTDMTTGLVWLKDASWGGAKAWSCEAELPSCFNAYDDAHTRAGILSNGMAGLSDGSVKGDWRLPTKSELVGIIQGEEAVSSQIPHLFIEVQSDLYWSSTAIEFSDGAWIVGMSIGAVTIFPKPNAFYVWPVRGGN